MNLQSLVICFVATLSTITNEASSIATGYGDILKQHTKHCAFTVKDRGPRRNRKCAFPFKFDGVVFDGVCTDAKDPDGLHWCSTKVNPKTRVHIGGKGHWGYCKPKCDNKPEKKETDNQDEISSDHVDNNNIDATTERSSQSNIPPKCEQAKYDTDFWRQSFRKLATHIPNVEDRPDWYNNKTMSGTYLPNEYDKTCGEKASFGFIVCPKGQNCDAKPGAYPFIAALGYKRRVRGSVVTRYACGGTLINRRYVMTAAHCQGEDKRNQIAEVVLGDYDLSRNPDCNGKFETDCWKPVQRFDVASRDVKMHENWNPLTVVGEGYDIALIRLPKVAHTVREVCDTSVLPICMSWGTLPNGRIVEMPEGPEGEEFTVMGWGRTNNKRGDSGDKKSGGAYKNVLQKLGLPHIKTEVCRTNPKWRSFHRITADRQICAGGKIHADSCAGDSGGPLIVQADERAKMYLKGIVSFGKRKCGTGYPGVYTDVEYYIDWIKANLKP